MSTRTNIKADDRFVKAVDHQEAGALSESAVLYAELIRDYGEDAEVLQRLGYALAGLGRLPEALSRFQAAVELSPDSASAWYNLGMAQDNLGDSRSASESFQRSLACDGNFHPAHFALSELALPYENYIDVLRRMHLWLKPATYLEVGVESGESLALAQPPTYCIGIDPAPCIKAEFSAPTRIFRKTSDEFFATHDLSSELAGRQLDLAFIDGLHHFDAALRDFINIERYSSPQTIVIFHDGIPLDEATSSRNRKTTFWSGDTWKVIPLLKKYRPDLKLFTIPAPPTGLTVVTGMDPTSTLLADRFDAIINEYMGLGYDSISDRKDSVLNVEYDDWASIRERIESYRCISE